MAAWHKAAEPLKAKWASQVKGVDPDTVYNDLVSELKKRTALAERCRPGARNRMDAFIDTIEWIAGGFVGLVAATFSTVAYPEMRRFNYPQSFATGAIAAGGTLGAMFPPSIVLAVYGPITQQDIGKLFMATIGIIGLLRPH